MTKEHSYSNKSFDEMEKRRFKYPIQNFVYNDEKEKNEKNKKDEKVYDNIFYCSKCFKFFSIKIWKINKINGNFKTFYINYNEIKGNSVNGFFFYYYNYLRDSAILLRIIKF